MKRLLMIPAIGLALLSGACRTAHPLCPMTMKPCVHTCLPTNAPHPCHCRCHGEIVVIPAK